MADFTPEQLFQSNFQISITLKAKGVEGWNFQGLIILTLSTNSEKKMNKIWKVRVSTSKNIEWFDMELSSNYPLAQIFSLGIYLLHLDDIKKIEK